MPRPAPRVRSALFVPGGRADFLAKADQRGADAIIIDLEDSVADGKLDEARANTGKWISSRPSPLNPVVCVRINALDEGRLNDDLAAIVYPQLTAVVVPKLSHEDEVREVADKLSFYEGARGMEHGTVRIWPLVETASAIQRADKVASASDRVAYMGAGTSRQGDIARAIRFQWSPENTETLFIRSKVLVDVRAAGVPNPVSGLVSIIDSTKEMEMLARQSRQLGYEGLMAIHPSHVAIINEVFSPTEAEIQEAKEVMEALADAEARGLGAVTYKGAMIDKAMAETIKAQGILD
jgi:citrate lyase subunit beta/citryl-CoA lyase